MAKKTDDGRRAVAVPARSTLRRNLSPSPSRHQKTSKVSDVRKRLGGRASNRTNQDSSPERNRSRSSSESRSRSSFSSSSSSTSSDSSSSSDSRGDTEQRRPATTTRKLLPSAGSAQRGAKVKTEGAKKKIGCGPTSAKQRSSQSSSLSSSSDSGEVDDGEEEENDGGDKSTSTIHSATRISLSERFGKLAQLSSQRARSLDELVQLRIVAPVGSSEKNVSVEAGKAAPVIFNNGRPSSRDRDHRQHLLQSANSTHLYEEPFRKDDRARDDRWREWHER